MRALSSGHPRGDIPQFLTWIPLGINCQTIRVNELFRPSFIKKKHFLVHRVVQLERKDSGFSIRQHFYGSYIWISTTIGDFTWSTTYHNFNISKLTCECHLEQSRIDVLTSFFILRRCIFSVIEYKYHQNRSKNRNLMLSAYPIALLAT